jgi:outer membrane protein assembly factor BamB
VAWKSAFGPGFSSFTVAGDRAYTLVSREIEGAKREVCVAVAAATGAELWAAPLGVSKYDGGGDAGASDNKGGDGPRSTPAVDGNRVYCLDSRLVLAALDAGSGKLLWSKDLVAEFGAKIISWQSAASPVLDGDLIFVCGGGETQALLAFNKKDGSVAWKGENEKPTHATPIVATVHGQRQVIFFTQSGLVSCATASGKVLWRHPHKFSVSTAASPVVSGDIVYCSAGYGVGASAARIAKNGEEWTATELWRIKGDDIANHWSSPVVKDGYVYGMYGCKRYGVGPLKCFELATGKEMWAKEGFGQGNLVLAGNQLLALSDSGELALIEAQSAAYKELGRTRVVEGKCWSTPVLSGGRVYVRSTKDGACLEFGKAVASR